MFRGQALRLQANHDRRMRPSSSHGEGDPHHFVAGRVDLSATKGEAGNEDVSDYDVCYWPDTCDAPPPLEPCEHYVHCPLCNTGNRFCLGTRCPYCHVDATELAKANMAMDYCVWCFDSEVGDYRKKLARGWPRGFVAI